MSRSSPTQSKKSPTVRDFSIIGDFIKYLLIFFIPFALIGIIYALIYQSYFMSILVNPVIYAVGFSSIIIVIKHDVNDILALIGQAKQPQLALHIKHANTIQLISVQMSSRSYEVALKTVNNLLKEEPTYANALNLKGQILLEGFKEIDKARSCFEKVLKLARPGTEDYKLAQALRAASYKV
jgi:tetratricopeptide (TPR) repeat protein